MSHKWKPQSTFQKLILAFLLIGVIPLIVVSLLFLRRYEDSYLRTLENTMGEANYYAQSKAEDLLIRVDQAAASMYDYSLSPYSELYEVLEDESLNWNERQLYVGLMLDQQLRVDPAVSAAHLVGADGTVYSRFYSQQKSPAGHSDPRHILLDDLDSSDLRCAILVAEANESLWCSGSSEAVISLARNYMDTRSLHSITGSVLGTLYIDIRTQALDELFSTLRLGKGGNVTLVNESTGAAIYRLNDENAVPLPRDLSWTGDRYTDGPYAIFYHPVGNTGCQLLVCFDRQELLSSFRANQFFLLVMLAAAVLLILTLGLGLSGRISHPACKLKSAMEEVRNGSLNAHVDIHSGDEMEYLGKGFNEMVETLSETIQEVYVAQICQRDAELNALKMQIRPHYLYNTLDVIRMSALENDDAKTARLIESLSLQLRYLMGTHQDRVTLRQELDNLREYQVLMEARYEGRIRITFEVADDDLELYLPKLLLQPFVENAIKHSLRDLPEGGTVHIEVMHLPDMLQIMIFNDGTPIDPDKLAHIKGFLAHSAVGQQDEAGIVSVGMKNTYDRIKINCGKAYGFTLDSHGVAGAVVTIRLPIWKEDVAHVESTAGR